MRPKVTHWPSLVELSTNHPKAVILITLAITVLFLLQLPKIQTDTDPKHMLPATSQVRVYNDQLDQWFALHKDTIILGIVNDQGILNIETLRRIAHLTEEISKLKGVVARDVTSFTTADNVTAEGDLLTVKPLMSKVPQSHLDGCHDGRGRDQYRLEHGASDRLGVPGAHHEFDDSSFWARARYPLRSSRTPRASPKQTSPSI